MFILMNHFCREQPAAAQATKLFFDWLIPASRVILCKDVKRSKYINQTEYAFDLLYFKVTKSMVWSWSAQKMFQEGTYIALLDTGWVRQVHILLSQFHCLILVLCTLRSRCLWLWWLWSGLFVFHQSFNGVRNGQVNPHLCWSVQAQSSHNETPLTP